MDVAAILKQIRERVVSEPHVGTNDTSLVPGGTSPNGSAPAATYGDALQRLHQSLTIASRAADRLPPVFSNREGARARFEIWIKNKSKPLTRWFTWEQVNFNRAVNDALSDLVEVLKSQAQELSSLRAQSADLRSQLTQHISALQVQAAEHGRQLQTIDERQLLEVARLTQLQTETSGRENELGNKYSQLLAEHSSLVAQYECLVVEHNGLAAEHSKLADQVIELAEQLRAEDREIKSEQAAEINRRLSQLAADLKEEQRVCFRQISLETGESAVREDRARRALMMRLEKIEAALKSGDRKSYVEL
jgi:DNA repair exonuclease SbcCD ATPase subunit